MKVFISTVILLLVSATSMAHLNLKNGLVVLKDYPPCPCIQTWNKSEAHGSCDDSGDVEYMNVGEADTNPGNKACYVDVLCENQANHNHWRRSTLFYNVNDPIFNCDGNLEIGTHCN